MTTRDSTSLTADFIHTAHAALIATAGNVSQAAARLDMFPSTLRKFLRAFPETLEGVEGYRAGAGRPKGINTPHPKKAKTRLPKLHLRRPVPVGPVCRLYHRNGCTRTPEEGKATCTLHLELEAQYHRDRYKKLKSSESL